MIRERLITGLSFGYRAQDLETCRATNARLLKRVKLLEVSLVTFPANEHARIFKMTEVA